MNAALQSRFPQKVWTGGVITEPGMYARVPMLAYHSADICDGVSISSSGLRTIIWESPAHFWDKSPLNPNRDTSDDGKEAFTLGRAVHHLVLGEAFFSKLFVIRPDEIGGMAFNLNRKTHRAWADGEVAKGRTILTAGQAERIRGMAMALGQFPAVRQGILNGMIERSLFWKDRETGIWMKIRPDVIPLTSADAADLKTTISVKREEMRKTIDKYHYYQQGALIQEGFKIVLGLDLETFTLVFVESKPPHCVGTIHLEPEDLKRGHDLNRRGRHLLLKCLKTKEWPGPAGYDIRYLGLGDKARERIDSMIQHGTDSND